MAMVVVGVLEAVVVVMVVAFSAAIMVTVAVMEAIA